MRFFIFIKCNFFSFYPYNKINNKQMKNLIIILVTILTLASCGNKEVVSKQVGESQTVVESPDILDFSNPAIIEGSNFGSFFIAMIKTQDYDRALKFTSKKSINKFGADKILKEYRNFDYNYHLIQKSISKNDSGFVVVYTTNQYATAKLKKIYLTLENDTCKLVLPDNIDDFLK